MNDNAKIHQQIIPAIGNLYQPSTMEQYAAYQSPTYSEMHDQAMCVAGYEGYRDVGDYEKPLDVPAILSDNGYFQDWQLGLGPGYVSNYASVPVNATPQ